MNNGQDLSHPNNATESAAVNESLTFAGIGIAALTCQWLAWRTRMPSIVFLLAAGLIAGPVAGVLDADVLLGDLLFPVVSLSVAVILFEGSLTLRFEELSNMGSALWRMLTVGVLVTWIVIASATHWLVGLDWQLAILFGAVMVVTGPTVIAPMLRSVRPNAVISRLLRWEGIVIDPLGAVLAILVFELILVSGAHGIVFESILILGRILAVGVFAGCLAGYCVGVVLRNHWLPEYLHNVGTLLVVIAVFAVSNAIEHESGLVAVTVMGIWLANMPKVRIDEILDFKESLSVLLVSGLFILLASRVDLGAMAQIGVPALGVVLAVQFIARPLKILASTVPSSLTWRERALLAWIAPRGIVAAAISALFALRLETAGFSGAELIVPLSFAVIIGTVVWQGLTAPRLARWLGVAQPPATGALFVGANPVARALAAKLAEHDIPAKVADSAWDNVREARMQGLDVYYGNPLSPHAERHLGLSGIGSVLAVSRRDDLNALACVHFGHELGRNAVFSLASSLARDRSEKHAVVMDHRGRELFGEDVSYSKLASLISQGAELRVTRLTESYDFATLRADDPNAIPLLAWTPDKALLFHVVGEPFEPAIGMRVMTLVPSPQQHDQEPAENAASR